MRLSLTRRPRGPRLLIAIPTIDRDVPLAADCFRAIAPLLRGGADLLVMARRSDERVHSEWPRLWSGLTLRTVAEYEIAGRHNCEALADQRNLAREQALQGGYDALFFVDSDIRIRPETFSLLWACIQAGADVAFAPYSVRWYGNRPIVGIHDAASGRFRVEEVSDVGGAVWSQSALGGMGCTLIHRQALDVPFRARSIGNVEGRLSVTGEDIGFFLECIRLGKRLCWVRHVVTHHLAAA